MQRTSPPRIQRRRILPFVLIGVGLVLIAIVDVAVFSYLRFRNSATQNAVAETVPNQAEPTVAEEDFSQADSVSIELGGDESGHGLSLVDHSDGQTVIESIDGVPARVARQRVGHPEAYVYFRIHPTFKQIDVRRVRIEIEYRDPQSGRMNIHYDALDKPSRQNPAYASAGSISLTGANTWRTATFLTKNDAVFENRQNGHADFRISAMAPVLYVRRVTVTREPVAEQLWPGDFSTSNDVSVLLGQDTSRDGLRHIDSVGDGHTTATNVDGISCRYLDPRAIRSPWGSLYFQISPSFKRTELMNARIEVEYLTMHGNAFRLQFDGMENGRRSRYVSVLPDGALAKRWLNRNAYAIPPSNGVWLVATFHVTNAMFMNSQNDDADFRFEVVPPEIYIRRVIVTREGATLP